MAVSAAMTPLIPLFAVSKGASPAMVGLIAASMAVLPLVLGIWTGGAVDALGPRGISVAAALVLAGAATLVAAAPTLSVLVVGTAIAGLANNMLILASQTSVAQVSRADNRDHSFGLFTFAVATGQLVGPMIGGVLADATSTRMALQFCAAMALVPGVFSLWLPGALSPKARPSERLRAGTAYRAAWRLGGRAEVRFIMLVAFTIVFAWSIKSSFYPLYLQSVGMSTSAIGLVFSFLGAGSVIVRPLIGAATARLGRWRVLTAAVLTAAVAIGVVPFLRTFWPLALAALVTGVAWGVTQPLTMSLMAGSVTLNERGLALGLRMTSNRLGEIVSPLAFATLVSWRGLGSAFFLSAVALAGGTLLTARFARAAYEGAQSQSDTEAPARRFEQGGGSPVQPSPARPDPE